MKRIYHIIKTQTLFSAIVVAGVLNATATDFPAGPKEKSYLGIDVDNIYRTEEDIVIDLSLDFSNVDMKSNFETIYTPMLVEGNDTVFFQSFTIVGHKRLLSNERNGRVEPITFYKNKLVGTEDGIGTRRRVNGTTYKLAPAATTNNSKVSNYSYELTAPYKGWMETSTFLVDTEVRGCANCVKDLNGEEPDWLAIAETDFTTRSYTPELLYVTPVAEAVKTRELAARAYIDFRVNRTEIDPTYRRNPQELAKIRSTIDSIRNDKDITVTSLHISGTASPEGSYQNNVRLAKGRTEALKDYVQGLYKFRPGFITTSFEPVDWQGLREFLEMVVSLQGTGGVVTPKDSIRIDQFKNIDFDPYSIGKTLPNAESILNIVNGSIEPYQKNQSIKNNYGSQYQWLLQNVYPALRHSDYRIEFEIRTYTAAEEIIEVMQTAPQKLSLAELFVAANSQPEGSPLYVQAMDMAVTMFPYDETANLNAAVSSIVRNDMERARNYIAKAGRSDEAHYIRALLTLFDGNEDEALGMLRQLMNSASPIVAKRATEAVNGLEEVRAANAITFRRL